MNELTNILEDVYNRSGSVNPYAPDDLSYKIEIYEFKIKCIFSKIVGGTRAETFSEVRAIPYVTIVRSLGTYNEDHNQFYTDIRIRFKYSSKFATSPKKAAKKIIDRIKKIKAVKQTKYIGGSFKES